MNENSTENQIGDIPQSSLDHKEYASWVNGLFILPDDPKEKHRPKAVSITLDFGDDGSVTFGGLMVMPATSIADILRQPGYIVSGQMLTSSSVDEPQVVQEEQPRRIDVAEVPYRKNTYIVSLYSNDEIVVQKHDGTIITNPSPTYNAIAKKYREKVGKE